MKKNGRFSLPLETKLIEKFLCACQGGPVFLNAQRATLNRFCQEYRDLYLGPSFLNESHSASWLKLWRNHRFAVGHCFKTIARTVATVRRWTGFLFSQRILDHDAFFYIKGAAFLQGEKKLPHLDVNLQRQIAVYIEERTALYRTNTANLYRRILQNFNQFQNAWEGRGNGWARLHDENLILAWLRDHEGRIDDRNLGVHLCVLRNFLDHLQKTGRISVNPADNLYARYPRRGWRGLACAGKSAEQLSVLKNLVPQTRFSGPWGSRMLEFILLKRRLGALYDFEERTLANLDRYLSKTGIELEEEPTFALIRDWLSQQSGSNAHTRNAKRQVTERFFEHLLNLGLIKQNPSRFRYGEPRRCKGSFIFSGDQVREILNRAEMLPDIPFFSNRGNTYAMIIATLYCLGLRVGEACRLTIGDVDLGKGLVLIHRSKFYKSRLLPLGPKLQAKLSQFLAIRTLLPNGTKCGAPLFSTMRGNPIRRGSIGRVFRTIARQMKLLPKPGQRNPCLHSFRHTFAVHRLLRWYREGANVQAKLPLLSAFMGHADICSTQVYLKDPEGALSEANYRFEAKFGTHYIKGELR